MARRCTLRERRRSHSLSLARWADVLPGFSAGKDANVGASGSGGLVTLVEPWAWLAATPGLLVMLVGLAVLSWPNPARRRLWHRLRAHFTSQPGFLNRVAATRWYLNLPNSRGNRVGRFIAEHWEEIGPDYTAVARVRLVGNGLMIIGLACALLPIAVSILV